MPGDKRTDNGSANKPLLDYNAIGLRVGLEIHQQLEGTKLFCPCPSILSEPIPGDGGLVRRLRATKSEMGETDAAASAAASRGLIYTYQVPGHTCLVECDEEPPHPTSEDAIDISLQFCAIVGASVGPEIYFMRKIVVDGSNTSGFQRTALMGRDGTLLVGDYSIRILTVCLEEDAARPVENRLSGITYRLDRLGIPLIEVATAPDITSPQMARDAALRIGTIIRATKKARRGIGTVRQDLNISINGGARVEIKGVQELNLIPAYVETEVRRQLGLIAAREELARRGIRSLGEEIIDCTDALVESKSRVISGALKTGGRVLGVKLPGFLGLLKGCLGPELAGYARMAGVHGLFHSDELPGYGVSVEDVSKLKNLLEVADGTMDAFVIVAEMEPVARKALEYTLERARYALIGVPEETRDPLPDGTSVYSRPLPGRARMYPETDIPAISISDERLLRIKNNLPEMPEIKVERFINEHGLSHEQAQQIVYGDYDQVFEDLVKKHGNGTLVARTLLNTIPEIRAGRLPEEIFKLIRPDDINKNVETYLALLDGAFSELQRGTFTKEGLPSVIALSATNNIEIIESARLLGFGVTDESEIDRVLDSLVSEKTDFIKKKGEDAIGPLMGEAMRLLRGKAEGRLISKKLAEKVHAVLGR